MENIHNNGASADTGLMLYQYPRSMPVAADMKVRINNQDIVVCKTSAGPFIAFSCKGPVTIDVTFNAPYDNICISPSRLSLVPEVSGNSVRIKIDGPGKLALMSGFTPLLYIYANPFPAGIPDAADPKVRYYRAGQIYEVGELKLHDNETLYIEGGAVIRGCVMASSAGNVKITGYGILDGSYYNMNERHRSIIFEDCKNSLIENIIMIEPTSWMIVLGICENITVRNVKQLGYISTTDGVDVVGSKHIRIENCFLRNGDDCVVVKAFDIMTYDKKSAAKSWRQDVEDVEVRDCILWSYGGMVFEIGHELTAGSVKNIRHINCDAVVHSFGGIFGIHNADCAAISNVLYENIRVEHYYNKLIDFKIIKTMYSGKGMPAGTDPRGQIRDVVLKDIHIQNTRFNQGISVSHIGGYDAKHKIQNVTFDNFRIDGEKVTNADQMDLYSKQASGIVFK